MYHTISEYDYIRGIATLKNNKAALIDYVLVEQLKSIGPNTLWLQTTQHTNSGAVTAVINCCANCVELSRPQQWRPDLQFFGASWPCRPTGWLALLLTKAGDVETNPSPTTLNKRVWICDTYYKQIHVRKQISIRCNRIEHWVHL